MSPRGFHFAWYKHATVAPKPRCAFAFRAVRLGVLHRCGLFPFVLPDFDQVRCVWNAGHAGDAVKIGPSHVGVLNSFVCGRRFVICMPAT